MKNIPKTCSNCGAPIKWNKSSSYIDCEYCGYSNLINLGSFSNLINSIKKIKTFSTSNLFKSKIDSSKLLVSNLSKRKKTILFLIPISLLSAALVGKLLEKENVPIPNSYIPAVPSNNSKTICNIREIFKESVYIQRAEFNSKFIGCWKNKNDSINLNISIISNKLNLIAWSNNMGGSGNLKENYEISDIYWDANNIYATFYMKSTNFKTKMTISIKDRNTLIDNWSKIGSSSVRTEELLRIKN